MANPVKLTRSVLILAAIGGLAFAAGLMMGASAHAEPRPIAGQQGTGQQVNGKKKPPRILYPSKTELDFEGTAIEGEVRNPGEFYFQHRREEKFDSLVKRRKNFHREMLRDVVLSK